MTQGNMSKRQRERMTSRRQREKGTSDRQRRYLTSSFGEMPVGNNDALQAWAEKMLQEGKVTTTQERRLRELTTAERKKLRTSQFAIPERRAYPIHDIEHARNALSRVSQHGTPEEKRRVRAAVARKFPQIGQEKKRSQT